MPGVAIRKVEIINDVKLDISKDIFSLHQGATVIPLHPEISRESAVKKFAERIGHHAGDIAVYISSDLVNASRIITWDGEKPFSDVGSNIGWFFMIDFFPKANWGHPCEYYFIDCRGEIFERREMNTPPRNHFRKSKLETPFK